jgi:flagellar motility protein MotE (MotC chaperone)
MLQPRLIPIVIFAATGLLAIKLVGFFASDGSDRAAVLASLEQRVAQYFAAHPAKVDDDLLITGSADQKRAGGGIQHSLAAQQDELGRQKGVAPPPGIPANVGGAQSPAERALIERLQERRQELEARTRDLEMREGLIKAAEKRLEDRIGELKALESKDGETSDQMKSLVVMYEAMRPRDAARIFDRLDVKVLIEVVDRMNPRKVAEVLALMQPETAERLTLQLALRRTETARAVPDTDLPRVEATSQR